MSNIFKYPQMFKYFQMFKYSQMKSNVKYCKLFPNVQTFSNTQIFSNETQCRIFWTVSKCFQIIQMFQRSANSNDSMSRFSLRHISSAPAATRSLSPGSVVGFSWGRSVLVLKFSSVTDCIVIFVYLEFS